MRLGQQGSLKAMKLDRCPCWVAGAGNLVPVTSVPPGSHHMHMHTHRHTLKRTPLPPTHTHTKGFFLPGLHSVHPGHGVQAQLLSLAGYLQLPALGTQN